MRRAILSLGIVLGIAGCGAAPAIRDEPAATSTSRAPSLAWEPGASVIEATGLGVAFVVRAEIARLGPAEIGSARCGPRLLHASVVDRRTFVTSDAVLARSFARAGCGIPETAVLSDVVIDGSETRAQLHFEDPELGGVWTVRAVTLPRGHRVVVIVSAVRGADDPLFDVVSDAPGLEDVTGTGHTRTASEDDRARQAMEIVFGVMRVMGEIGRALH